MCKSVRSQPSHVYRAVRRQARCAYKSERTDKIPLCVQSCEETGPSVGKGYKEADLLYKGPKKKGLMVFRSKYMSL